MSETGCGKTCDARLQVVAHMRASRDRLIGNLGSFRTTDSGWYTFGMTHFPCVGWTLLTWRAGEKGREVEWHSVGDVRKNKDWVGCE